MSVSTPVTVGDPGTEQGPSRVERLLLPAAFITNLGNNIQIIAAALLLIQANKSESPAFAVSWLFIAIAVPQMLLSVYFGRLADRFDRRMMCIVSDVFSMFAAVALPLWWAAGLPVNTGVYLSNFALALSAALFMPASNGLIKERVSEARIGKFNANFDIASQAGTLLSAGLGGLAIKFYGAEPLLFFNGLTFLTSALLIFAIGRRPVRPVVGSIAADGSVVEAPVESAPPTRAPVVRIAMLVSLVFVTITLSNVLNPVFILDTLGKDTDIVGYVDALAGIGIMVAAMTYKRVSRRVGNFTLAIVAFTACAALTAFQSSFGLIGIMILLPVGAITLGTASIASRTLLMTSVAESRVSQVFGAVNAFRLGFATVAALTIAKLSDSSNIHYAFYVFGGLILVVSAVTGLLLFRTPQESRATSW